MIKLIKKIWNFYPVKVFVASLFILADGGILEANIGGDYNVLVGVLVGLPGFMLITDAFRRLSEYDKEILDICNRNKND